MKFEFLKDIYNKEALLRAAYNFTDVAYMHLGADKKNYIVNISMKDGNDDICERDFLNEVIAHMVRQNIREKTKNVRELIIARAFSSTVIENNTLINPQAATEDINDILVDWFKKYE